MPLPMNRREVLRGIRNAAPGSGRLLYVGPAAGDIRGSSALSFDGTTFTVAAVADIATVQTGAVKTAPNSGTNAAGATLTIAAGQGTGTGAGGSIVFQTADGGGNSGASSNALATALTIADDKAATFEGNVIVKGDLTLDDGGSIKEAGGVAAITVNASGDITKLGTTPPSDTHVLTWSAQAARWESAAASGGGGGGGGGTASNDIDLILHTQVFG